MGVYFDWTDVELSDEDRAAASAGKPVSADAMMEAARDYVQDIEDNYGGDVGNSPPSFYDPDLYYEAMSGEPPSRE